MRNIEIKARIQDLKGLLEKAKLISNSEGTIIKQHDTFYKIPQGRFKLRKFESGNSELIYYNRLDVEGPKLSTYKKLDIDKRDTDDFHTIMSDALGIVGAVEKVRHLFLVSQTRIHVDIVKGLGNFVELEVVLAPEQTVHEGERIAYSLMELLDIRKNDLISGAYQDLMNS
ncbi:hypothetical protein FQA39_LY02162 [Lamprigera yunnana]|nr:hypothetical protein FQA39_LY02162 [Lamprigera yunnana]